MKKVILPKGFLLPVFTAYFLRDEDDNSLICFRFFTFKDIAYSGSKTLYRIEDHRPRVEYVYLDELNRRIEKIVSEKDFCLDHEREVEELRPLFHSGKVSRHQRIYKGFAFYFSFFTLTFRMKVRTSRKFKILPE